MQKIKIRESISRGWSLYTKRPWYLLGLALGVIILMIVTASDSVMATALSYIAYGGFVALMFAHYSGEHISFDNMFDSLDTRWISFAFLGVIKGLLILVGLLCLIVPGVYLAVRWMFAEYYVIEKGMRPMEALKASSALTQGHWWKLFAFCLVTGLLMLLGVLFFVVGLVIASIVATLASIHVYKTLQATQQPASPLEPLEAEV